MKTYVIFERGWKHQGQVGWIGGPLISTDPRLTKVHVRPLPEAPPGHRARPLITANRSALREVTAAEMSLLKVLPAR